MIKATLIDHMGCDMSVVNAARVSFGKKIDRMYTKPEDEKLIRYLAEHKHMSPFGHCFATFHVKAPVFVARQLVKHKFLRWNEISRRYVDDKPEFYEPEVWRGRSADKKQGSEGVITTLEWSERDSDYDGYYPDDKKYLQPWVNYEDTPQNITQGLYEQVKDVYRILLECECAPEMARMLLPQSMMTEWIWSGSLDAFADMCRLRCKPDTQYESRLVADQISAEMAKLFPVSWESLMENNNV